MPRILVIGHRGQVGHALTQLAPAVGEVITAGRDEEAMIHIDLLNNQQIEQALSSARPDWIINAAAYNAVDQAEDEPDLALQINGTAPAVIGQWAAKRGATFIHYSTDYVFDGQQDTPYTEDSQTRPISAYGQSKLAGETAVLASGTVGAVLRTSWVFSTHGQNFLNTMRKLLSEREQLSIVDDQIGVPTWAQHLAEWTLALLNQDRTHQDCALLHASNSGTTSRYDFVVAIREALQALGMQNLAPLEPIPSAEFPQAAVRPLYSVMSNERLTLRLGTALPDWQQALQECLNPD